jgi:hypothetical protein
MTDGLWEVGGEGSIRSITTKIDTNEGDNAQRAISVERERGRSKLEEIHNVSENLRDELLNVLTQAQIRKS